jgi:DNA-directed RNA polymerase subunit RPC12/RpoP
MSAVAKLETRPCPKCGSRNVQRRKSRGLGVVVRLTGFGFYRCSACGHRFSRYRGWGKIHTRILLGSLLLTVFVLITWFVLSRMGSSPPPE